MNTSEMTASQLATIDPHIGLRETEPSPLYLELESLRPIAEELKALVKKLEAVERPILYELANDPSGAGTYVKIVNAAISDLVDADCGFGYLDMALNEA